jgi:AraC-like DNA-binding protein
MASVLQKSADNYDPRGRLDPAGFQQHIVFHTYKPPASLASFIEHFWVLRWDRAGQQPYISEQVMHRPYVDVYVSRYDSGIQCTFRGKRAYKAEGADRIIGARFKPGAFHAFWQGSLARLYDKTIDIQQVFPEVDTHFVEHMLSLDNQAAVRVLAKLFQAKKPRPDSKIELINRIIAAIEIDGNLQTVKAVAKMFLKSERWLQQLFSEYVGIGIKWLLQRKKLLEAAKYIRENDQLDWAALAYDFGYSSQQHFITDFKRVLGKTPLQYKKELTL